MKEEVREKDVEKYLVKEVKRLGGIPFKFTSPNRRSVPDRLCLFPHGLAIFCELKAPGKVETDGQKRERHRIQKLGHMAVVLASIFQVSTLIQTVEEQLEGYHE